MSDLERMLDAPKDAPYPDGLAPVEEGGTPSDTPPAPAPRVYAPLVPEERDRTRPDGQGGAGHAL